MEPPIDPSKKTGLGSSAGLIVSFLAATLSYFNIIEYSSPDCEQQLTRLHVYSQILNAFVQEKIGSGFDIACAVYGS